MRRLAILLIGVIASGFGTVGAPAASPQLVYSTYVGTGGGSALHGLAVDSDGSVYVAGSGPSAYGTSCGFLTKLDPTGKSAVWSICLPLTELDGVALDGSGAIYVVGTNTAIVDHNQTTEPSTILKLSAADQSIVYSVQLSGAYASQIAVDGAGSVSIAGRADPTFIPTAAAYSTNRSSRTFAAKLTPDGTVVYATYLDMLGTTGIAISSTGELWLAGTACPVAYRRVPCDSGTAAAVRKLNPNGASISVTLTFGGGPLQVDAGDLRDSARSVAVDRSSGAAWVVGYDASLTVPTTADALMRVSGNPRGVGSGYAIQLSPSGVLLYGTYLSDPLTSTVDSVALDATGNVFIGGGPLLALSPDGRTPLLSIAPGLLQIVIDPRGGLYGALFACTTTPDAYEPFVPPGRTAACVSKFDLTQISETQIALPSNAASLAQSSVFAPGELITLSGANLPANPQVSFDGNPAPIVYSDATRITTAVPFRVGASVIGLRVEGVRGFNLQVWPYAPGLFTADGSGKGLLDARNQDGSINSKDNPADTGSIVAVFMTGAGAMVPTIGDGELGPAAPPFPVPVLPIYAQVNGIYTLVFAAQAPGMVAGIVRVDIQIPSGTRSGEARVVVLVNNDVTRPSQFGTIAVR